MNYAITMAALMIQGALMGAIAGQMFGPFSLMLFLVCIGNTALTVAYSFFLRRHISDLRR